MSEETTELEESETQEETVEETEDGSMTLDIEAIDEYQSRIEELNRELEQREETIEHLTETVEQQQEQLSQLEGQFEDLSARVADGRNLGVCPECNGPTERKSRLFRSDTIECNRCREVVHTY